MASWQERTAKIQVGDEVAYSAAFCRNTGQQTGPTPFMRGTVIEVKPLGDRLLCTIDWHDGNEPGKAMESVLARVTSKGIMEPG